MGVLDAGDRVIRIGGANGSLDRSCIARGFFDDDDPVLILAMRVGLGRGLVWHHFSTSRPHSGHTCCRMTFLLRPQLQ